MNLFSWGNLLTPARDFLYTISMFLGCGKIMSARKKRGKCIIHLWGHSKQKSLRNIKDPKQQSNQWLKIFIQRNLIFLKAVAARKQGWWVRRAVSETGRDKRTRSWIRRSYKMLWIRSGNIWSKLEKWIPGGKNSRQLTGSSHSRALRRRCQPRMWIKYTRLRTMTRI